MIPRTLAKTLKLQIDLQPAVCLLGPRQVGKTTLARQIAERCESIYLDLESPIDNAKLEEPLEFFRLHRGKLIVLDEIHRVPGLFPVLRGVIDDERRSGRLNGMFLILGSASLDLLKQSSETLAGRISFLELTPFIVPEVTDTKLLALRGGFPSSFLSISDQHSLLWRQDFVRTYLERDISQFGPRIPAETLRRFWTMLAHNQGQLLNNARLASALGVSAVTVNRYLDLLVDLLLVRRLTPWISNVGKRLVRSPKVFIRDSGLVHALLNLQTEDAVMSHPVAGASWEGFVIENILNNLPFGADFGFYRTADGAEADLIIRLPSQEILAVEIKRSVIPKVDRGFHIACEDLKVNRRFLVYRGEERVSLGAGLVACDLPTIINELLASG